MSRPKSRKLSDAELASMTKLELIEEMQAITDLVDQLTEELTIREMQNS